MIVNDDVTNRVLDYIKNHPGAGGTIDGVTEWWVGLQELHPSYDELTVVLETLVDRELIRQIDCGEDAFIYVAV